MGAAIVSTPQYRVTVPDFAVAKEVIEAIIRNSSGELNIDILDLETMTVTRYRRAG